jgi:membrane-bound lytic murein transglycosylase MltF
MGTLASAIRPRLRDEPLSTRALAHARGVAADWRAAGLAVDLVEHRTPAGRRDGYVLTARSPTQVLRCECRSWRLLGRSGPRAGTLLWSIDVLVGRAVGAAGTAGGSETLRRAGVAMAIAHDLAWRQVLEWIDGGPALPADLDAALDQAAPRPAAGSGSRPVAALLAGALALGALAAYGAWRAEPTTNEVRSGPATAAPAHGVPDVAREPAVAITVRPPQQTEAGPDGRSGSQPPAAARRAGPSARQLAAVGGPGAAAAAWRLPADRFPAERGTYRGDLDAMLKKGAVRVLTAYSKTDFFVDKGESGGVTYEYMRAFEASLQKRRGPKQPRPTVYFVPVSRDRLISALLAGEGDLVAANLTVTPERERQVDFSAPYLEDVKEVVATGPASPGLATLEDLAGKEVWVRRSSSYWGSLEALGRRFAAEKRPPPRLVEADEHLEDEDLLDMLNAGLIPLMVVDDHKARLWAKMLPNITVREDISAREKGRIAFAVRKRSPKLKAALDAFVGENEKGTTFGNIVFDRYLAETDLVKDASSEAERRKFEKVLDLFRRFGDRYGFDHLMLAAQGYQESRLDNSVRSKAGAVGIMQVLPATAKDPNVDIAHIEVLENNIHAAAKYMRFVMDTFFPGARMDPFNRTMFAFASYNAGPAKIARLRRQAASRGLDPDRWFGQVERVVAEKVGREPVQYVSNILKYYIVYRRTAALQARKERALEAALAKPS